MKIKTACTYFISGLFLLASLIVMINAISLSKTEQIQGIWQEFDNHRSDRLSALIALRRELGYGGMIHRFKNYILRQNKKDFRAIISSIGGAKAALARYKSLQLDTVEETAIIQIESMLNLYLNALNQVDKLIQQNKSARQIDGIVRIDDFFALKALKTLENKTPLIKTEKLINHNSRPLLLNSLRTAMGYGGMIHAFKNYILRYSPEMLERVKSDANNIEAIVNLYRQYNLSIIEKKALTDILLVVQSYRENLSVIQQMSGKGESAQAIDKIVVVNDVPALDAFNDLQREINKSNEFRAKQLDDALRVVQISGESIVYITLTAFILLISTALWMMKSLVVNPISRLTCIMSRLAKNDLNVEVSGTKQKTEIGEMARAVEIFKKNAIKKQKMENELAELNAQLEEKVYQRTKKLEENEVKLDAILKQAIEGEERLKILINTAMDALIQIDEDGTLIGWNKQAEIIFGWSVTDVLGKKLHDLIIPKVHQAQHIKGIERFLTTEKPVILNTRIEITALHRDGHEFPIELSISPIKFREHYQFSAFIRDISEQKKTEQTIIQAKEQAESANQAKSLFLANMSHELRTPMHGILGFAQAGLKKSDTATREKIHKYFSNIKTSGDRLLVLLNDLLDLSKLEANMMELNLKEGDLADFFSTCCQEQEQYIKDSFLKIQFTKPASPVTGLFDHLRITQVMANFLSNAIKFSSEGDTLTATISEDDKQALCFSLQDEGIGIPEDELETVFNAFVQSSKTKTNAGGTGLGLAICKEIIEAHGGTIWAENTPEGGALFQFVIPATAKTG